MSAETEQSDSESAVPYILVIDDDQGIRGLAEQMLNSMGYGVVASSDGLQGFGDYMTYRDYIVCIILDLNLPNMNGEETLKRIRDAGGQLPVIVTSGFSEMFITPEMRSLGIAAFLEKPFSYEALQSVIARVISG